jgi:hypothetical protein
VYLRRLLLNHSTDALRIGLWKRPDFQSVYNTTTYELCLDALQKPGVERSQFEIDALSKLLSGTRILNCLDDELQEELLRLAGLKILPKGSVLYSKNDLVHFVYIVKSGVLQLSSVDEPPRDPIKISVGDSCGFPIDTRAIAEQKQLMRMSASSRRWQMLRRPFTKENAGEGTSEEDAEGMWILR